MDWRVFSNDLWRDFSGGDGDKTAQLAAMTMAAQSKNPWAVFIAAASRSQPSPRLACWLERAGSYCACLEISGWRRCLSCVIGY